jgi:hypothetical protein
MESDPNHLSGFGVYQGFEPDRTASGHRSRFMLQTFSASPTNFSRTARITNTANVSQMSLLSSWCARFKIGSSSYRRFCTTQTKGAVVGRQLLSAELGLIERFARECIAINDNFKREARLFGVAAGFPAGSSPD